MEILRTAIPAVLRLTPRRFADSRGDFCETWSARVFAAAGIAGPFVQDNLSRSIRSGTVRGLHCQAPPHAQGKLVRAARGRILDV
ncbi:MAG: dTDP-4-dehydrorhamnose 3,5-epimerase, partial [Rhodobacterales bacterium CG_4_10_14_0_8_um_filter_70_9]